jgi:hypothetical protein
MTVNEVDLSANAKRIRGTQNICITRTAIHLVISERAMPTIDLTAAVTAAIRRAIEKDRFPRAPHLDPLRSALAKLDPAAAKLSPKRQHTRAVRSPAV